MTADSIIHFQTQLLLRMFMHTKPVLGYGSCRYTWKQMDTNNETNMLSGKTVKSKYCACS